VLHPCCSSTVPFQYNTSTDNNTTTVRLVDALGREEILAAVPTPYRSSDSTVQNKVKIPNARRARMLESSSRSYLIKYYLVKTRQNRLYGILTIRYTDQSTGIAEQSRAEQSRAKQSRAEQSRAEQSRAEQSRAEQSSTCQDQGR
jgi:hypothetical protein